MIPELGHIALIVALFVAVVLGVLPLSGVLLRNSRLMALAGPAAFAQFATLAFS